MTTKTPIEAVHELLPELSHTQQQEVKDFVEFLLQKTQRQEVEGEELAWSSFSLSNAMRDVENDVAYDESDLQETWS